MTDSAPAIAIGPIFDALRPMISAVVTAIVGVAVTFGVALLKRWTGVSLQATYVDSLRRAAQTEAGVLVAEAADNLSLSIHYRHITDHSSGRCTDSRSDARSRKSCRKNARGSRSPCNG